MQFHLNLILTFHLLCSNIVCPVNLQKNIFRVEEREDVKLIYNEFNDEMNNKLEEFRANII